MSHWQWRDSNQLRLLENGEEYYPAVFAAIAAATDEVLIETFILFEDKVGRDLEAAIAMASQRGAHIELTVDGYGSEKLSSAFIERMRGLGVVLRMFEPFPRFFGNRINLLRRLHHKIVVVDQRLSYVGGINFSEDHLLASGPQSKQDYAVQVEGPLVEDIRELVLRVNQSSSSRASWFRRWWHVPIPTPADTLRPAVALLACRDNHRHFDDIERLYRIAIRTARQRIVIANAYFFPGYRLLRELTRAAQRGVRVQLILQGNPDMPLVRFITRTLYLRLARAGVEIHEYCERPMHAKVAVIDGEWATVGSSNLDPLSLAFNLEANVFMADRTFAEQLSLKLDGLLENSCEKLDRQRLTDASWWGVLLGVIAYHVSRHFSNLARRLPALRPQSRVLSKAARKLNSNPGRSP
ncbi:MAG: cardiolipin synthase ClsB [Pseudomonadota bacterium]